MNGTGTDPGRPSRRPPRLLTYVLLSVPLALASYLAVQIVYLWELERSGALVRNYDFARIIEETGTVHLGSLAAWLVISALFGCAAQRVTQRLYEAQRRLGERRETEALTDPHTGLDNRRALEERLAVLHPLAERYRRPFSVISIDADGLKARNDTDGHAAGDRAIRHLADVLRATMRSVDQCVRLGGDEFIVLLPDTGAATATTAAERLLAALRTLSSSAPPGGALRASVGVAEWVPGLSPQDVIRRADALLYEAKRLGKDQVVAAPPRPWAELLPVRDPSEPLGS